MASGSKTGRCMSWGDFVPVHEPQLISIGLPNSLWKKLYQKLSPKEIHDADSSFELRKGQGGDGPWSLHARRTLPRESDVFLLDHVWSTDGGSKAKEQLKKSPELVAKLREVMGLDEGNEDVHMADYLDSVEVLARVGGVGEETARKALEGSNNELLEALCRISHEDYNRSNASDSSKEPEKPLSFEDFKTGFLQTVGPEREAFVSAEYIQKMYERYVRDKQGNPDSSSLGTGQTAHYSWSEEEDGSITVHVSVPANTKKRDITNTLTPKKWTFGIKGKEAIIDGYFHDTISPSDSFWTIDSPGVVQMLLQKPEHGESALWPVLLKDEKQLTEKEIVQQASQEDQDRSDKVNEIMEHMWYYNHTYQAVMSAGGPQESVWYIMNKMGSAIKHSNQPNLKCAPFVYAATRAVFSLIWPLRDLDTGEKCTRNVCPLLMPSETAIQREARVLAFKFDVPDEIPAAFIKQLAEQSVLPKADHLAINITPLSNDNSHKAKSPKLTLDLKFYLDKPDIQVQSALKHVGCQLLSSSKEADAVWISGSFLPDDFTAKQKVNRLKGEECLLERHLLSTLVQESFGEVSWFPVVYDLRSQLPAIHANYHLGGFPSYWVIKSANPSKFPLKPVVSSNLKRISRLVETGPVVASKLCLQTAICHKRNFCLQYSVMVESSRPPVLLIHQTPNIRLAEKEYDPLQALDEYDSSAILTSARKNVATTHGITFQEFLEDLTKNYLEKKNLVWNEVQNKILQSIAKLFAAVSPVLPDCEGGPCAVYGVDVLLRESLEPLIIGVDSVPSFPDEQCAQDVLYLVYAKQKLHAVAAQQVFRVSIAEDQT